jgi:hypothetical protein
MSYFRGTLIALCFAMKNLTYIFLLLLLPVLLCACGRTEFAPASAANASANGPGDSFPDSTAQPPAAPLPTGQTPAAPGVQPSPDIAQQPNAYPPGQPVPDGAPVAVSDDTQAAADYFSPQLASYGQWINVPDYGPCWQPTNVSADWRPYTLGHWAWSDQYGWLWVSDEPFGWACYHYGRWAQLGNGWCWVPGRVWGPSWVVWRGGDGVCGWAPLPPLRRGRTMAVEIGAIHPFAFNFVREEFLTDPRVRDHCEPVTRNVTFINETRNITKIERVDGRIVNHGVEVTQIEKASGKKVEHVTVAEANSPREVTQRERTATVFRPEIPAKPATPRRVEPQVRPEPAKREPAVATPPAAAPDNRQQETRAYYDHLNTEMQQRHQQELQSAKEDAARQQLQTRQDSERKFLELQQQRLTAPSITPKTPGPPAGVPGTPRGDLGKGPPDRKDNK